MENNYSPAGNKFCIDVIGQYSMMEYNRLMVNLQLPDSTPAIHDL